MPLAAFRTLVNSAYEAARQILVPQMLIGTRSATLDFQMAEPKFSSLVLALKEPLINFTNLERRLKKLERATKEPLQASAIAAEIGANSAHFVQQMDEIALPQPKAK